MYYFFVVTRCSFFHIYHKGHGDRSCHILVIFTHVSFCQSWNRKTTSKDHPMIWWSIAHYMRRGGWQEMSISEVSDCHATRTKQDIKLPNVPPRFLDCSADNSQQTTARKGNICTKQVWSGNNHLSPMLKLQNSLINQYGRWAETILMCKQREINKNNLQAFFDRKTFFSWNCHKVFFKTGSTKQRTCCKKDTLHKRFRKKEKKNSQFTADQTISCLSTYG